MGILDIIYVTCVGIFMLYVYGKEARTILNEKNAINLQFCYVTGVYYSVGVKLSKKFIPYVIVDLKTISLSLKYDY